MNERTFNLPPPASTIAGAYDELFYFIYGLSVFFFVIITVGTIVFTIKWRAKKGEEQKLTSGFCHNTPLELLWSIIPTVLFFVIFIWGFKLYLRYVVIPANATEINVTAWQWNWNFTYPEGAESNILVVPKGKPVKLVMSSNDVIHSLFIPDFRVKMDVLPNRYTSMWFQSDYEGEYDLYCTEYCGQQHSTMVTQVHVKSASDYKKWIEENSVTPTGDVLYKRYACNTCHSLDGSASNGPTFKNLFGKEETLTDGSTVTVDENYLRESILEPQAKIVSGFEGSVMPPFQNTINNDKLDALILFIKSLKEE